MPGEPPASRPAAIAQTAERTPRKRQVAGSCPARGSNGSRAPSGAGPSLPLAPSRTASFSLTAGPTFAGMGRAIRFSSGPSPSGRAPRSQRGGRGFESRRLHHAQRIEVGTQSYGRVPDARNTQTNGRPPPGRARGRGGDAPMARRRRACGSGPNPGGARRRIGGTLILRGNSQNVRASPGVPARRNTGMDGGPCGKGAVLLRLLGRKSLASSTLAPSASRSAVIGHGIGPLESSQQNGLIGNGGMQSGIRVRRIRAHSLMV